MGLLVPTWSVEALGIEVSQAYVRLHRYGRHSALDGAGRVGLAGLQAEFLVYASQAARDAGKNAIGSVMVTLAAEEVTWAADLGPQAYAELKTRYPDAVDVI